MIKIKLFCYFRGDNFSESEIIKNTGIILNSVREKELKKVLPFKQFKKVVTIIPEDNKITDDDYLMLISKFTKFIKEVKLKTKEVNYNNTVLLIDVMYEDQCNLALPKTILDDISKTFDNLHISCDEIVSL